MSSVPDNFSYMMANDPRMQDKQSFEVYVSGYVEVEANSKEEAIEFAKDEVDYSELEYEVQ